MSSVVFAKNLANRVREITGYNIFHVPQSITPQSDIYGFISVNYFEWTMDFGKARQPIGGSIILYAPAAVGGLPGSQYGYEHLMELAEMDSDSSLITQLNTDRTVNGTCSGFMAMTAQIQPLPDPDPEYSVGMAWTMEMQFQAMI